MRVRDANGALHNACHLGITLMCPQKAAVHGEGWMRARTAREQDGPVAAPFGCPRTASEAPRGGPGGPDPMSADYSDSHLPSLKRYMLMPPSRMSPFLSNAIVPVTPDTLSFCSAGRYFDGSAEFAAFIASTSAIAAS